MTIRCMSIACGDETGEKEVKMGRAELLPSVSHTQVKAYTRKQDPTYTGPFPRTQNLKNILGYIRTELHTQEYKLRT